MAKKRTFNEEDHQVNDDRDLQVRAKKRHGDPQQAEATDPSVIIRTALEVMLPTVRQMMKEEFQLAMLQNPCCCRLRQNQECATSGGRPLQLYFENSLPQQMFTLENLRAEDGRPLQIKLRGPEGVVMEEVGTMNLQICVLDGDFGTDGNEDWTAEEFNSQFVKPKDWKGPLLKGETVIKLEKGVAVINNNIGFTDNSCNTRSKHYRLGVKVKQSNNFVRTDIREARSGPVRVFDRRGKGKKKPDRPALDDEVWLLKNIKEKGPLHLQLSDNGIISVKDLLRFNTTGSLLEKFGNIKGWDKIIEHAKKCELDDDERYIYHGMENSLSLVFNCIYEVVGVKFSGQNCDRSLQSLSSEEKRLVERVKQVAYRNLKDLVPIETAHHDMANALTDTLVAPYGAPDQGQPVQLSCHSQPFIYASCTNQGVHDPLPSIGEMGQNSHTLGGFNYPEGNSWDLDGSHFPLVQGGCSIENESLDIEFVNDCLPYTTWEPETGFFFGSSHGAEINSSYSTLINSAVDIKITGKTKACISGVHLYYLVLQRLVPKEFERKLSSRTTINEIGTSGSKSWELVKKDLPAKIYTFSKIKCVEVALYDTRSQSIVTDGPLSSIKVEICVLNGDFGCEDWTTDEFNAKILRQRDNKGRLLKGETNITLENGVGYIPDFVITDNSSWIRDGRFRLGVKVLQSNLNHAINIKEGRSNSFIVRDYRGKPNQKDCAPSINDEICCLKYIPKNGKTHQRVRSQGISTVKDLLQELEVETNPSSLQKKFGNISKKYRDKIIEHAKKAKDVDTCVAEATFDGWNYHSEKNIVNSDKGEAYKNWKDQVPIETITQELESLTQTTQHGIPNQDLQQLDFLIALQEEISRQMEPPNWSAGGQFVPGPSHNIDDGNIWGQIDQICTPPIDPLFFDSFSYGDGAEPSNHSSFPPDPKGNRKMD